MSNGKPKVLAFAGSTRGSSLNKKLVRVAATGAEHAGADVTFIDLRDFPLPMYDGDIEAAGFPNEALALRRLLLEHQGFLIASPEYNGSFPAVLKNAIDWTSRPTTAGEDGLAPYRNKVIVLMSASPGSFGGLRGLVHVRAVLGNIGGIVLPDQLAVGKANEAFAPDGSMTDQKQQHAVAMLGETLATTLSKLHGQPLYPVPQERRHDLGRPMA